MYLSWRIRITMVVVSLFLGGCQAAVGDSCPVGTECTATGEICSNGVCVCDPATQYTNGVVCVTKVAAGLSCAGLPTDACSACVDSICTCNQGFYDSDGGGSSGTCVPQIAAGNNCAGLPADACSTNSVCVGNICTCNQGFYDSDGGGSSGTCVPQIALSGTCNNNLGVTQCVTSGAVCETDNICRCSTGSFDDNGFNTAGGVCRDMSLLVVTGVTTTNLGRSSVRISWTAPVTYSGQVNRYEVTWTSTQGGGTRSAGTATFLDVTGLQSATQYSFTVKTFESGSQTSEQEVTTSPALIITTEAELSQMCDGTILCGDVRSECIAGNTGSDVCRCQSGYYDSNGYSTAGGVCKDMNGLIVTSLAVGVEGTSTVTIEWAAPSPGSDQVNRYEVHWTPALSNGTDNYNAEKATSVRLTGFVFGQQYTFYVKSIETGSRDIPQEVQTTVIIITINAGLNINCGGSIHCADSNAECTLADDGTNNICRCKSTYFDSNGYSNPGGMCIAMSTLAMTGLTLAKEGTDIVNVNWTPPSQYTDQVSRYEVHWSPSATINGNPFYNALLTTAVQLVGFVPGQTYTFTVYSVESGSRSQEQSTAISSSPLTMKPSTPSGFTDTDVDGPELQILLQD